jgi:hypothetical protein
MQIFPYIGVGDFWNILVLFPKYFWSLPRRRGAVEIAIALGT